MDIPQLQPFSSIAVFHCSPVVSTASWVGTHATDDLELAADEQQQLSTELMRPQLARRLAAVPSQDDQLAKIDG